MKRIPAVTLYCALSGLLLFFLLDADALRESGRAALALCAHTVIPALLPFLIVSRLLIHLGFGPWLGRRFAWLMGPLFRLPGSGAAALLLGFLGGYPIGAETAAALYNEGQLTKEEAERLLHFCSNSNPVFFLSVLGLGVFRNVRVGLWLWLIHLLSALLSGIFFRGRGNTPLSVSGSSFQCLSLSLPAALAKSIREGAFTMLNISVCVVFFSMLLSPILTLAGDGAALPVGLVELFSMIPLLVPDRRGFVLAALCSGWGGLSVLSQTAAVLEGSGLSIRAYAEGKALQALLSALLAFLLCPMIFP